MEGVGASGGRKDKNGKKGRACVVVLGDLGRSPRMQYHSLSLARQAQVEVDIVAYGGSQPHSALLEHESINIHTLTQLPKALQGLPKILRPVVLILKPLVQILMLLWFLIFKIPRPDFFLVQNPPSVPTLMAVKWASSLRHSAFIVDWHNFGHTLLALSLGRSSIFVTIYRWIEKHYGRMADGSLCVTRAMQHELAENWGIKATILYDQPPEFFRPASFNEKHEVNLVILYQLSKVPRIFILSSKYNNISHSSCFVDYIKICFSHLVLKTVLAVVTIKIHLFAIPLENQRNNSFESSYKFFAGSFGVISHDQNETPFTAQVGSGILLKPNRPALVVSSTSWTSDEDFSILLEAAVMYDRRVAAMLNEDDSMNEEFLWKEICEGNQYLYPRLLFIITGKGPEKEKYEEKIRRLHLKRVAFRTMWLTAEDYPLLLGSADLGVCLHTSSSGLDLPMKIVDMFGCGLPVCAVSYSCINELVEVEKTGLLFSSSSELADELLMLFKGFPDDCNALKVLRNGVLEKGFSARWDREWEEHAKPLISQVM